MALIHATKSARGEIQDILMSGNYYVTEEIARELSAINNALEHLSLDGTFLSTSADWQKKPGNFAPNQITGHMSGAMCTINQVGNKLAELKGRLGTRVVQEKQENELRELHQWAVSSLKNSQKELEPYTYDAADRIKQFGDSIGVTDRYTGYRQNLTRGTRDPFKMQSTWMDPSGQLGLMNNLTRSHTTVGSPALDQRVASRGMRPTASLDCTQFGPVPPSNIGAMKKQIRFGTANPPMRVTKGYRTIDSLYPKSSACMDGGAAPGSAVMNEVKSLNAKNACAQYERMEQQANRCAAPRQPYEELSVQEQAGINTTFPGKTEYMQRFKAPDTDLPTPDFKINPSPNFAIYGRPMQRACYIPSFTEYQTRYEWPDSEKIVKLPWLRN
ncbi:beta propeller repeat TECPR [Elysia marginata]|uniref:Beta propeller repeat TECPR n=1 Tax=Elysia marginata TaxID=1093978 RepID=A0AAV4ELJ1_9GAST|nr:beta propeller repeat TECPR [Elysia marginata]